MQNIPKIPTRKIKIPISRLKPGITVVNKDMNEILGSLVWSGYPKDLPPELRPENTIPDKNCFGVVVSRGAGMKFFHYDTEDPGSAVCIVPTNLPIIPPEAIEIGMVIQKRLKPGNLRYWTREEIAGYGTITGIRSFAELSPTQIARLLTEEVAVELEKSPTNFNSNELAKLTVVECYDELFIYPNWTTSSPHIPNMVCCSDKEMVLGNHRIDADGLLTLFGFDLEFKKGDKPNEWVSRVEIPTNRLGLEIVDQIADVNDIAWGLGDFLSGVDDIKFEGIELKLYSGQHVVSFDIVISVSP